MWQQIPSFFILFLFSEKEHFCGISSTRFIVKFGRLKNLNFNHTQTLAFEFNSHFTLTQFSSLSFFYHSVEFSFSFIRHTVCVCFFLFFSKSWYIKFYCHFGTTELNLGNRRWFVGRRGEWGGKVCFGKCYYFYFYILFEFKLTVSIFSTPSLFLFPFSTEVYFSLWRYLTFMNKVFFAFILSFSESVNEITMCAEKVLIYIYIIIYFNCLISLLNSFTIFAENYHIFNTTNVRKKMV